NTTAFLASINELEKQPITLAMPTELKSLSLLEKRVEKHIRNLLTQNETSQPEADEAKDAEATQAPNEVDAAQDSATSGTTN
ncbi:uroporphyrinogen-III C-methyltransferase, partial [Proteus mirabilis]|uniref:uroporphyrinogen-III C-methyltransferase n=1 Tax=Proteus mirabilis TaxID=584 RepID=UPI0025779A58